MVRKTLRNAKYLVMSALGTEPLGSMPAPSCFEKPFLYDVLETPPTPDDYVVTARSISISDCIVRPMSLSRWRASLKRRDLGLSPFAIEGWSRFLCDYLITSEDFPCASS